MPRMLTGCFMFLFSVFSASAQSQLVDMYELLDRAGFPENYEARSLLADVVTAPAHTALRAPARKYRQASSPDFEVAFDVHKTGDAFYLIFRNGSGDDFPTAARGNWIIKRDLESGAVLQVKIFIQNDENSFVRITPDGKGTRMEVHLYGRKICSSVPLSVSPEDLLLSPFARIMRLSEPWIDWTALFADISYPEWALVARLADEAGGQLYLINEATDGCQNAFGAFVRIEDGRPQEYPQGFNCSGFAKWIADGFYAGYREAPEGPWLDPVVLKKVRPETRGDGNPWSRKLSEQDPYFGLDWVRNIALELYRVSTGSDETDSTRFDLREVPFHAFTPSVGFQTDGLESLVYLAAIRHPGRVWFAVVNSPPDASGLRKYHHVAVFFPWFDSRGDFHAAVLDTGRLTTVGDFARRFPDSHVLFVSVRPPLRFAPPPLR